MNNPFWKLSVYRYIIAGCGLFFVLSTLAMFTYPGGNFQEDLTTGYDFFRNFFSDLGRIGVSGGRSNLVSAILFASALTLAGAGLAAFFLAFRDFFLADSPSRWLSLAGTVIGVISGLCFMGIAFTPYDIFFDIHYQLVFWAFRTFLAAVAIYTVVIFRQRTYPRGNGWVFVAFTILLAAYLALLTYGPAADTDAGLIIQATGQKIIAYVSILSVSVQAWFAICFRAANSE